MTREHGPRRHMGLKLSGFRELSPQTRIPVGSPSVHHCAPTDPLPRSYPGVWSRIGSLLVDLFELTGGYGGWGGGAPGAHDFGTNWRMGKKILHFLALFHRSQPKSHIFPCPSNLTALRKLPLTVSERWQKSLRLDGYPACRMPFLSADETITWCMPLPKKLLRSQVHNDSRARVDLGCPFAQRLARAFAPPSLHPPLHCSCGVIVVSIFRLRKRQLPSVTAVTARDLHGHRRGWRKHRLPRLTNIKLCDVLELSRNFLMLLLHHPSFRFVRFSIFGFSSVPVLYHEASLLLERISIPTCERHRPTAFIEERRIKHQKKKKKKKKPQNVRPRKEAECLAGLYQICQATTNGIRQRFGSFKASTISGIYSPPPIDCNIIQHTCGSWCQVGQSSVILHPPWMHTTDAVLTHHTSVATHPSSH